jgi:DNA-binding NarL/FixJ family response regulator
MPPTYTVEGLRAAQSIRSEFPEIGIVVLSAHLEPEHAMELLANGSRVGYLLKNQVVDVGEFIEALDRIAKGRTVVDPSVINELLAAHRPDNPLAVLSPREREVLALMAEGRSNAGIGTRLFVSEGTVEKHVRSMFAKLELGDTVDDHRRVLAVIRYLDAL